MKHKARNAGLVVVGICDRVVALGGLLLAGASRLHAQLRLLGLVLEDQAFEHGLRGLASLVVELLQRLELQAQGVIGAALVLVEQQFVGADGQRLA